MALLAHYKLDGNVKDSVGLTPTSVYGSFTWVNSNFGQAAYTNSASDYFTADVGPLRGELSLAFWYRCDFVNAEWVDIISKRNGDADNEINLRFHSNGTSMQCYWGNGSAPKSVMSFARTDLFPSLNVWYHVTITKKPGEKLSIFRDGNIVRSAFVSNELSSDTQKPIKVMNNDNNNISPDGAIHDLRIYDHCLSLGEVKDIANRPSSINYYPGFDATGSTKASIDDQGSVHSATFKQNPRARYIRDWTDGSTSNSGNHWLEVRAMFDGQNISLNKPVTASVPGTRLTKITDGNTSNSGYAQASGNSVWVQVDLGYVQEIDEVRVWHYNSDGRTYYGTKTEISEDGVNWTKIFDSAVDGTYQETTAGITHKALPPGPPGVTTDGVRASEISEVGTTRGLVAWYPLSGTTQNHCGGVDAEAIGAVPDIQGYKLDGVDDVIAMNGPSFTSSEAWSFSHLIYWDVHTDGWVFYAGVGSTTRGFLLTKSSSQVFTYRDKNSAYLTFGSNGPVRNKWCHLCWVADGLGNLSLYVNGEFRNTHTANTEMYFQLLGKGYSGDLYLLKGNFADVRIHNVALTPEEIAMQAKIALSPDFKTAFTANCLYTKGQIKEVIC